MEQRGTEKGRDKVNTTDENRKECRPSENKKDTLKQKEKVNGNS